MAPREIDGRGRIEVLWACRTEPGLGYPLCRKSRLVDEYAARLNIPRPCLALVLLLPARPEVADDYMGDGWCSRKLEDQGCFVVLVSVWIELMGNWDKSWRVANRSVGGAPK